MTLRLRLVVALLVLTTAGLAVFGYGTYSLYARAQYDRLDERLQSSRTPLTAQLVRALQDGGSGGPPLPVPSGTYAELRDASGKVLTYVNATEDGTATGDLPDLSSIEIDPTGRVTVTTTGSIDGDTEWRVSAGLAHDRFAPGSDDAVIVAFPTTEVTDALDRLLLIEGLAGAALLALLASGSWFIVRHGLRPLERMATSAGSITAGNLDLSQRVAPAEPRTEVGQLGLAINTMLGELEDAFAERDATEQKLRQFLADASHELRTPLTSIQGFAELFRLGAADDPEHLAVVLRRIEQESARMKTLVDDLLLLARLDQTRPVERAAVDLAVLAADACTDARAVAPDRAVTLEAPHPVVVSGDAGHLRQAIGNLMANAIKHTAPATPIQVWARHEGDVGVVTVRDHGTGLDDEALERVFDRFWQADAARVGAGSGLGLSIVDGIAHEHGGTVSVANAPGGGAVFTLRIPLMAPTGPAALPPPAAG